MATFKPVVFKTGKNVKSDGTTNIKIRVYHNKESQYIPTEYYIEPNYMGDDGSILAFHPGADLFNFQLGEIIQKYRKVGLQLGAERSSKMSCSEYRDYITQATQPGFDFIDFVKFSEEHIIKTKKKKTAEWYQQSLDSFVWYYGKSKIDARDITRLKIREWMEQLHVAGQTGRPLENGSISNYVRGLRVLYNECKKKYNNPDHNIIRIPNEPFNLEIPVYRKKRRNLTVEKIILVRDFVPDFPRTEMARDVFMMQFYLMGINIGDLYKLREPCFGRVEYERSKTNTDNNTDPILMSIRVEPELKILFEKYSKDSFISELKKYSDTDSFRSSINKGIKVIGKIIGVPQISTNWARHSWASIARNRAKIPVADIDLCLGHSSRNHRMADIYIETEYSIFDEANRKVLDLLK